MGQDGNKSCISLCLSTSIYVALILNLVQPIAYSKTPKALNTSNITPALFFQAHIKCSPADL